MSERKLAHIEQIEWIKDIPGADKIELCGILGWQCVIAKKDNFKIGDFVVYIEVDSIVPEDPMFEFLRDRKFRVKTIKLRGVLSQGLVTPISVLPSKIKISLGLDVSDILKITKYLSPSEKEEFETEQKNISLEKNRLKKFMMRYSWFRRIFLSRKCKSGFPYWVQKTNEERIQNLGEKFLIENADKYVYVTEKVDYQSGTWASKKVPKFSGILGKLLPLKKVLFVVASRNLQTNNKDSLYWKIAEKYNLKSICKKYPGIIIQGEQGNSKIQKNKYGLVHPKMWIFNVIMPGIGWLNYEEMNSFREKNNLDIVPFIGYYRLGDICPNMESAIEFAKGESKLAKINREGVVIRCIEDGKKVLSFKIINNDFLLEHNE